MAEPRGVEERITWFLTHKPDLDGDGKADSGACAHHTWFSLGGDRGNPPAWHCRNANEVYAKVVASGRYFKTEPPRGAVVLYRYGRYGHACLSAGNGRIVTTDPSGRPGGTGIESISYPERWGASPNARIWTDQYNGVRFPVTVMPTVSLTRVRAASLTDPKKPAGTSVAVPEVTRVEKALSKEGLLLSEHVDGHYGTKTIEAYKKWQRKLGYTGDDADGLPGNTSLSALGKKYGFKVVA